MSSREAVIRLKTTEEIETLAAGGKILAEILEDLAKRIAPGVTGQELEARARELMKQQNVAPAFLNYDSGGHTPYPAVLCISVNEGVVHGIPSEVPFAEGDLVGLDCGLIYQGLYLDSARTVPVGNISSEAQELLEVTYEALQRGIEAAQLGNTTGHIGEAVQTYVEGEGFGVVRALVGHGVGYAVHEEPKVPNFGEAGEGDELTEGLVIAIEPMVTLGDPEVTTAADGWTIVTKDGSLSAHEEHTVAITAAGPRILTAV